MIQILPITDLRTHTADFLQRQRAKYEAVIRLLDEWMADESGYDEAVWQIVKQDLKENRLSDRRRFVD